MSSNHLTSATPEELENMVQALQAEISNTTHSTQNFQIDLDELLSVDSTTPSTTTTTTTLLTHFNHTTTAISSSSSSSSSSLLRPTLIHSPIPQATTAQKNQPQQRRATAPAISSPGRPQNTQTTGTQQKNRQGLQTPSHASNAPPQGNQILETILTTLPMEKQTAMRGLFTQLQQGNLTPETFLQQAHGLLGTRGAALLASSPAVPPGSPTPPNASHHQGQQRNTPLTRHPPATPTNYMSPTYDFIRKRREEEAANASSSKKQKSDTSLPPRPMGPPPFPPGGYRPSPSAPSAMTMPRTGSFGGPMFSRTPLPLGRPSPLGTPGAAASDDKVDYDSLTDVMGYAGVDLKAESDAFLAHGDTYGGGSLAMMDRSRNQSFLNTAVLRKTIEGIAKAHRIPHVDVDVLSYLALAAQERIRSLIEQMVETSKHRITSQAQAPAPLRDDGTPLYKITITQDVKKQLLALERVEREEEQRRKEAVAKREQKEAGEDGETGIEGGGGEEEEGGGGKKGNKSKKSSAKPMSARNMPDDIRKRISNQTALLSAGIVQRSWMTSGSGSSTGPSTSSSAPAVSSSGDAKSNADKSRQGRLGATLEATNTASSVGGVSGSAPRRLMMGAHGTAKRITVRDALLTLETDGGGGLGAGTVEKVMMRGFTRWMK